MDKEKIALMRKVVKYNRGRAYFDKFTAAGLDAAFGLFRHTRDWDKPITQASVNVGKIDGVVICRALWYEMSYNPVRFGTVSPFLHKGKESIYRFCDSDIPQNAPGFKLLEKLHGEMIHFMTLNQNPNGGWNATVNTNDQGMVQIKLVDGCADKNYEMLSSLRKMIHWIATQNLKDFDRKSYRTEMLKVISERHPNGIRNNVTHNTYTPKPVQPTIIENTFEDAENERIEIETDKIWKASDRIVSVDEYKREEIEKNLTLQIAQSLQEYEEAKTHARKKGKCKTR